MNSRVTDFAFVRRSRFAVVLESVGSSTYQYSRLSVPFSKKYATRCSAGRCRPLGFAQPPRVRVASGGVPLVEEAALPLPPPSEDTKPEV